MIELKDSDYFGEGKCQKCYIHPLNNDLCIKISKQTKESHLANEIKYCKKISKKRIRKNDYQFFSKLHGSVETNLGSGYVFDLIKDETTNEVSKTLDYYLLNPSPEISFETIKLEFERLIQLMIKYKVIANDINPKNICCKILKDSTIQLIHIDGLGHKDFIPLVDWFSFFTKNKIDRRLIKLDVIMRNTYAKTLK